MREAARGYAQAGSGRAHARNQRHKTAADSWDRANIVLRQGA